MSWRKITVKQASRSKVKIRIAPNTIENIIENIALKLSRGENDER